MRIERRGAIIGIILGAAALASGIFVINYTETLPLVVILWVILPVMVLQFVRWIRSKFRRD
ncbi:MAG: hypothetical protein OEV21_05370 [Thermoplasmata archaeon]|nr:hypothetical protein [Thermoplasmata archaeon]